MNTIALDLGTTTGFAIKMVDGAVISGTQSFRPQRFEGGGMRYLRFVRWLDELARHKPMRIYFEEVRRHAGTDAAHIYGGLMAHLTGWCEHYQVPYQGVPVQTIKKHATGRGNASKDMVIAAIKSMGYSPADDNEADALALLDYVISEAR